MADVEIVTERPRLSVLRLIGGFGVRQAHRALTELGDRLGEALTGTVVLVAPPASTHTLADHYLVRAIENMVVLEGGSFRLVA